MTHRPSKKYMRSTNPIYKEDSEDTTINKTGEITNMEFLGIEMNGTTGKIYTDQTGSFPVTSRKGTKDVFVLYCYEANEIIIETLEDRKVKEIPIS